MVLYEISQTNSAPTSSNSRIKPKTYRLCVPNLVKKSQLWYIPERRESFTSRSAEVMSWCVLCMDVCAFHVSFQSNRDNTWSIALQLHAHLIGLVSDWSLGIMGSWTVLQKSNCIKYSYCAGRKLFYNKQFQVLNWRIEINRCSMSWKYQYISRKISQASRFLAKSPDSRNIIFCRNSPC